ncbi:uncharacterized protein LOC125852796 [Solanum stenotomum]|uniref:uncharacterized protein LOC125852796 n=1 Tax=Solanum stenotomum TaxID=172797 RepID=UPI0020D0BBE5|nr:uncharacterized protein LOC125852796 [Solanum stenotomum]
MKRLRTANEEKEEIGIFMGITKTVKLNVNELDSVGDVKALLYDKEGMPKLVDYGICKNSTLHAVVEDTAPVITLFVRRSYPEDIIIVYSKSYDTIQDVKFWIAAKQGTNIGEFSLIHDGKFLDEDKPLSFLKIGDGSVLRMVLNRNDKFLIFVITRTHGIIQIEVKATICVRDVKIVIESKVGYSVHNMDLFMGEPKLDDQKELYQYEIKEECFLKLLKA